MARKSTKSNLVLNEKIQEQVLEAIGELASEHAEEIQTAIEEADDKKQTVNFAVELDCSESAPTINVRCRFSTSVTDRRTIRCDDPNQETFSIMTPEQLKKADEKKAKAAAKANKEQAESGAGDGGDGKN